MFLSVFLKGSVCHKLQLKLLSFWTLSFFSCSKKNTMFGNWICFSSQLKRCLPRSIIGRATLDHWAPVSSHFTTYGWSVHLGVGPLWESWPYFMSVGSDCCSYIWLGLPSLRRMGLSIIICHQLSLHNMYIFSSTYNLQSIS